MMRIPIVIPTKEESVVDQGREKQIPRARNRRFGMTTCWVNLLIG